MSYFLSDFSSHNTKPIRKVNFWSNLIIAVCQYRRTPVITLTELRKCLLWKGMPPMCLKGVLDEMEKNKTVCVKDKFIQTWSQWGLQILASPLTNAWKKISRSVDQEKDFVIVSIYQKIRDDLLADLDAQAKHLFTKSEWEAFLLKHVAKSNVESFTQLLYSHGDIVIHGDPTLLVKVKTSKDSKVSPVSEIDIAIVKAELTKKHLHDRTQYLNSEISKLCSNAKASRSRQEALNILKRKKIYELSLQRWEGMLNNTESLLLQLCESQHHKDVIVTLKTGADALQQNRVSLSEIDKVMDQLDEYKEYEEDLTEALTSSSHKESEEDLEIELEKILNEHEVIDLTKDDETEVALSNCPDVPTDYNLNESNQAVEDDLIPIHIKNRLSPETRRKPGRKITEGVLLNR